MNSRYRALMRRKLLQDILDRMSEDERRTFFLVASEDRSHDEIMSALKEQRQTIDEVARKIGKHPFVSDLLANVAGNYITEAVSWVVRALRRL